MAVSALPLITAFHVANVQSTPGENVCARVSENRTALRNVSLPHHAPAALFTGESTIGSSAKDGSGGVAHLSDGQAGDEIAGRQDFRRSPNSSGAADEGLAVGGGGYGGGGGDGQGGGPQGHHRRGSVGTAPSAGSAVEGGGRLSRRSRVRSKVGRTGGTGRGVVEVVGWG